MIFVRNGNYEFRVERNSVYGRFFVSTLHILYCRLSAIFKNILEKERGHGDDAKELVMQTGMIVLLFVIGLLVESYVNPIFLKKMLKIF